MSDKIIGHVQSVGHLAQNVGLVFQHRNHMTFKCQKIQKKIILELKIIFEERVFLVTTLSLFVFILFVVQFNTITTLTRLFFRQ